MKTNGERKPRKFILSARPHDDDDDDDDEVFLIKTLKCTHSLQTKKCSIGQQLAK